MIKKLAAVSATLLSVAFAAPAQAQWSPLGTLGNGGEYWDNASDDGTNCNIGYVVTGVAGDANNPCNNQRPVGWLPYTNTTPVVNVFRTSPFLAFFGGGVDIVQQTGQGGDVAGQDRAWGVWYTTNADFSGKTVVNVNTTGTFSSTFNGFYWGFWVSTTDGVDRFSDVDQQFAMFGRQVGSEVGGPFVVGIEDINTRAGGDRDYQDMIAQVTIEGGFEIAPKPSTYALMAAGLAALGLAARRRRTV